MKFRNAYLKFGARNPMFEADGGSSGGAGGSSSDGGSGSDGDGQDPDSPSYEELVTQLAQERANSQRFKNALDKTSSDLANTKKQLKEKMTAEEQLAEEQRIEQEQRDAEFNSMKKQLQVINTSKKYMGLGMDEALAETVATAFIDGDEDAFFKHLSDHIKAVKEGALSEFLKSRPDIAAGVGGDQKESLAEQKARELAENRKTSRNANPDILKNYQ